MTLLIAEDDERMARVLSREFGRFAVHVAHNVADASAIVGQHERMLGAILDVSLPDGSGLDVLARIRGRGMRCPVLVLTSRFEQELVEAAQLHGAEYLPKPTPLENLQAFARRLEEYAQRAGGADDDAMARAERGLASLAERCFLTTREVEVVRLALAHTPREDMLGRLGITRNTLKTHVRAILRKTQAGSVRELVKQVREERSPS